MLAVIAADAGEPAFEVSRRTVARDLDFLRDEERAPLAYDDARHGFRLTDETYTLPPVRTSAPN